MAFTVSVAYCLASQALLVVDHLLDPTLCRIQIFTVLNFALRGLVSRLISGLQVCCA